MRQESIDKKKIITLWGILDLTCLGWYVGWRIIHGQIPFYHDISRSMELNAVFGSPSWSIITVFSLVLYLSLLLSGIFLIKHNRIGAILCYIQAPFRLLMLIPPSIFFLTWPLKYIFNSESIRSAILKHSPYSLDVVAFIAVTVLVLLSEILKLISVFNWHRIIKTV
jgi:hypothetical protein